jgi:hypothetical protein
MVLSVGGTVATSAQERSLAINRGTFVFVASDSRGTFDLDGTGGLRLQATVALADGNFAAIDRCNTVPECPPGTVLDLSAGWGGLGVTGTARFRGNTYDMGGGNSGASLVVALAGSAVLPPLSEGPVTVSAPFDFAGRFAYDLNDMAKELLLTGGGIVTLTLVPQAENLGTWAIQQAVFEFRPPGQRQSPGGQVRGAETLARPGSRHARADPLDAAWWLSDPSRK